MKTKKTLNCRQDGNMTRLQVALDCRRPKKKNINGSGSDFFVFQRGKFKLGVDDNK